MSLDSEWTNSECICSRWTKRYLWLPELPVKILLHLSMLIQMVLLLCHSLTVM